ncbi:hypothetical protein BMS3Bbin10_02772 [bacterium BMS3Bbin10]|nr:hypothetical protein BMS3Bbin10_02772 [bacterium BMS3Bbin10]
MSVEAWITLWSALLWVSVGAFGAVTAYVAIGYARRLLQK